MFWKDKTVLITGHTGFKGSWLTLWLQTLGANVIGFALPPPTNPNLFTISEVEKYITSIIGDIRDYDAFLRVVKQSKPDVIFHLAAQPLVRYSYQHPIETYHTNVMGTVHLLEAVKAVDSVKAVVNVTTDKCYENKSEGTAFAETDRLGGYDPYSNSKACSELVTSAFRCSYDNFKHSVGLATARAGNVIGGGDWADDRLLPDIVRAYVNKQDLPIRYPNATRPWQYVLEPIQGYLMLAEKLFNNPEQFSDSYNFGPNHDDIKSVHWIVNYITKHFYTGLSCIFDTNEQAYEASCLTLNCDKAKRQLGWHPQWNLAMTIQETIAWYNAYHAGHNMHKFMLGQLNTFNSRCYDSMSTAHEII